MKKPGIILASAGGLLALGVFVYVSAIRPARPLPTPSPTLQAQASGSPSAQQAGNYVDYRDGIIQVTSGAKVLFFHAPWCPQCRKLDQSIRSGVIPPGVTIIKVDYDSNQELRKQYGVTIQTTFVRVDDSGSLLKRYVAYDTPSLEAVAANVLK